MKDWRSILKTHFDAENGSFLLNLRGENTWDRRAFDQLIHAMKSCCISSAADESLERWIAAGFLSTGASTRNWLSHSASRLNRSAEYYKAATELLFELEYWYFLGESPAGAEADPDLYSLTLPD